MLQFRLKPFCCELLIPLLIVGITMILRLQNIDLMSITQDESSMIRYAQEGILHKGYPFRWRGGVEFLMSTYELVPYPIAISLFFLGLSEFAVRLPAVIFSTGTVLLIYYFAYHLFDRRSAILAATLYAVLPWSIFWGTNCFYPSQVQFFALLTIIIVHHIISMQSVGNIWFYYLAISFLLTYFSWEVSGILLPIFFITALILQRLQRQWLLNIHVWIVVCSLVLIVIAQLAYRTLLRSPFEKLGATLADISFLRLAITRVDYDPFYYIKIFYTYEGHLLLIVFLVIGIFFLKSTFNLRFLYILIISSLLFLTSFLGLYALRYSYFLLPLVIISASSASFLLLDRIQWELKEVKTPTTVLYRRMNMLILSASHILVAMPFGIQAKALFPDNMESNLEFRYHDKGQSFRDIAYELKKRYRQGDKVIVQAPSPLIVYTGIQGDYFLQSIVFSSVFFSTHTFPHYMDKWVGNAVLRNKEELEEMLYRHRRVWYVSVPYYRNLKRLDQEIQDYINSNMKVIAEGHKGRLYLWEQ